MVVLCGSVVFDYILNVDLSFCDAGLDSHTAPSWNVSFLAQSLRQEFGGCAANIAYAMACLDEKPLVVSSIGEDGADYLQRLSALKLDTQGIQVVKGKQTARAFVTTDAVGNQLVTFYSGATEQAAKPSQCAHLADASLVVISPDNLDAMLSYVQYCRCNQLSFVFDPGQMLNAFGLAELEEAVEHAQYMVVNEHESSLLSQKLGRNLETIAYGLAALVVTQGENGARFYVQGQCLNFDAVAPSQVLDPTGCGDAFRAGFLIGVTRQWPWEVIGRVSCLLGALKVASYGGQNYTLSWEVLQQLYQQHFGAVLPN